VCRAYKEIFPRAVVIPQNGNTEELVERLKAQELDAALVTLPLAADAFVVQPIMHESLVVCIRRDDPPCGSSRAKRRRSQWQAGYFQ
jgi:DNA-binding transcriptional LysR family regulator